MDKILSKEDILGADDKRVEVVPVPEWGGSVRIRTLSAAAAESLSGRDNVSNAEIVALGLCNEEGGTLFSKEDVKVLAQRNGAVIGMLARRIVVFNGLSAEAVEDLKGN